MSEGSAVANIWTIWSCDHGPLKGRAVLLQCREDDAAMAEALAAAIGHPVTKLDWDIARTADGSSWNAGEGLDTEAQAKAAAIEQGYALIDRAGNRATAEMNAEVARAAAGIPPATPDSFACKKCGALPSEGCRTPGRYGCPYNEQPRAQGQCKWCEKPATERNGLCKTCDQDIPF